MSARNAQDRSFCLVRLAAATPMSHNEPQEERLHDRFFPPEIGGLFSCHDFRQLRNLCRLVIAQMTTDIEICSRLHAYSA